MLRHQRSLPRLPIPELEDTCALYLELVEPLVSAGELAATRLAVDGFLAPDGPGETLQRRLVERSVTAENWLEPFWDDWYLCDDTPLPVNVSPGFVLDGPRRPQAARAAALVYAATRFALAVDAESLDPDVENGEPRCMREYARVLSSTRVPAAHRDRLQHYPDSRHVVVVCRGRLFAVDVLDDGGRPYAVDDIEDALRQILDGAAEDTPCVGVLTTQSRRAWARDRERLRNSSAANRAALDDVESALFVLCLDETPAPASAVSEEAARMVLHGDGRGRWFDKSIQLLVAPTGVAGFCMEHAGFDGRTALRFAEFLVEHERGTDGQAAPAGSASSPRPLRFELDPTLTEAVARAEHGIDALVTRTDLALLAFEQFGKRAIAGWDLSPDAFVQMAFQLAYGRLAGGPASTYESVDTKRFLHGRTEAMRAVSAESVAFVRAVDEQTLRAAVARHTERVRRCREGRGVDRHLLGLRRMIAPGEPMPELFADPAYEKLSRSVLSTSSTRSSPAVAFSCFGPVVDEGLGISYTVAEHEIRIVVTSFCGMARAFGEELERCLVEMRALAAQSTR